MPTLAVTLDRALGTPLGAQLATAVRERVGDGRLAPGTRLPSSRALARDLGVARSVVEQAWAQLVAEGWLEGRHGAGTFVAAVRLSPDAGARPAPAPAPGPALLRLSAGHPWVDPAHHAAWRRAWREVGTAAPPAGYPDPRGDADLRAALAERLRRTRGLAVTGDDVRLTSGTTEGLRHLLAGLPPGPVGVEDPGYRAAVAVVRATGRTVVDVPALRPPARAEELAGLVAHYVTPAHQHPLGPVMPAPARAALLAAAREAGTLVVEDDYDSEFRYDVAPVPALASLDPGRVALLGTVSKSVSPALRLGWLVAPTAALERVDAYREVTHDTPSWPAQRALLSLLRDGYVDHAVRSARRVYARRAARVTQVLGPWLGGPVAGMYPSLPLPAARAEAAHRAARAAGYDVPLLSDAARSSGATGLVLGFGGCTDAQLEEALAAIRGALA
ncbi:MocR-like pyridoxine biosynthesis transcription factor PdxR [Nocardioides bruguierae]|uniref:PLP-dependent aminotransferase family protein n=1 Tax=Nocardioides bruguierae TaxID=2945102 RepID=A0A9X2D5T6_9ACTN|nr:PLP-dependent aminotransferase family protein [Nocardioides bruguierae]MCM0619785.1 PLP-dependent aminotransferase family protein [Nocardioides bruguierae]